MEYIYVEASQQTDKQHPGNLYAKVLWYYKILVFGNSTSLVFPHKGPGTRKMIPFDDVIMG